LGAKLEAYWEIWGLTAAIKVEDQKSFLGAFEENGTTSFETLASVGIEHALRSIEPVRTRYRLAHADMELSKSLTKVGAMFCTEPIEAEFIPPGGDCSTMTLEKLVGMTRDEPVDCLCRACDRDKRYVESSAHLGAKVRDQTVAQVVSAPAEIEIAGIMPRALAGRLEGCGKVAPAGIEERAG
jgi:hypothetical protein